MYAVISNPEVSLTRATLRNAELGFFGVVVYTRVQTPRRCGQDFAFYLPLFQVALIAVLLAYVF